MTKVGSIQCSSGTDKVVSVSLDTGFVGEELQKGLLHSQKSELLEN